MLGPTSQCLRCKSDLVGKGLCVGLHRHSWCCQRKLLELQVWAVSSLHFGSFVHLLFRCLCNHNCCLEKRLGHCCPLAHHFAPPLPVHLATPGQRTGRSAEAGHPHPHPLLLCTVEQKWAPQSLQERGASLQTRHGFTLISNESISW